MKLMEIKYAESIQENIELDPIIKIINNLLILILIKISLLLVFNI